MRVITEKDIIEARMRVAEAERKNEQQDFADALLASPDLTPEMVRTWLDATVHVHWCACEGTDDTPRIVCETCGLPPFWTAAPQQATPVRLCARCNLEIDNLQGQYIVVGVTGDVCHRCISLDDAILAIAKGM